MICIKILTGVMILLFIASLFIRCRRRKLAGAELDEVIRYLRTHDKMGKSVEQLREEILHHLHKQQ